MNGWARRNLQAPSQEFKGNPELRIPENWVIKTQSEHVTWGITWTRFPVHQLDCQNKANIRYTVQEKVVPSVIWSALAMPLTYRVQIDPQPSRAALNESHKKTWITGPNQPLKWMNDYGVICAKAQTQLKQSSKSQRHNDSIVSPHSLFQHLSVLLANNVLHIFAFVYVSIFFLQTWKNACACEGICAPWPVSLLERICQSSQGLKRFW